ncbi:hypothetical protein [Streptomyces sp. NPDC056982]|uniref:hypothetical protein n=1 Tax=Streptomyces sp. NPDC056982 TaxID=3345986 RepID=UPI00362A08E1
MRGEWDGQGDVTPAKVGGAATGLAGQLGVPTCFLSAISTSYRDWLDASAWAVTAPADPAVGGGDRGLGAFRVRESFLQFEELHMLFVRRTLLLNQIVRKFDSHVPAS